MKNNSALTLKKLAVYSSALLMLSGCGTMEKQGIAISTLCREWGRSLPTRSREDTEQTQKEIGRAYAVYEAACRNF
jgi:hypothetical protein